MLKKRVRERDASACMRRHQAFALAPVPTDGLIMWWMTCYAVCLCDVAGSMLCVTWNEMS